LIIILAKRITLKQKEEIIRLFISGTNIDQISQKFKCTKLTVSRNLKNNLDEVTYKELLAASKSKNKLIKNKEQKVIDTNNNYNQNNVNLQNNNLNGIVYGDLEEEFLKKSEFIEIAPLNYDIESKSQREFASIPICEIDFPKMVFMIVDNKIELEIKYLKDYPKWNFLAQEELERKTIEIYYDLKVAKSFCGKEQKVIKVPNPFVFKIVAPMLLSRGISRIVSPDKLIAL
tara:strand:+ start:142 stop:834 length:693 start_codon:yes stop_codon:yes gene_type:complete